MEVVESDHSSNITDFEGLRHFGLLYGLELNRFDA